MRTVAVFVLLLTCTMAFAEEKPGAGPSRPGLGPGIVREWVDVVERIGGILARPIQNIQQACQQIEDAFRACDDARLMSDNYGDRQARLRVLTSFRNAIRTFNGNFLALVGNNVAPNNVLCRPAAASFNNCVRQTVNRIVQSNEGDDLPIFASVRQPTGTGATRSPLVELTIHGNALDVAEDPRHRGGYQFQGPPQEDGQTQGAR